MSREITKRPEWLDEQLFEPIIEKELNLDKSKFVINLTLVKPAVAEGENYISMVYRVGLEVKGAIEDFTKAFSFIIKSSISGFKMVEELQIFEKEMIFFEKIVPKLNEFGGGSIKFGPKCYTTAYKSAKLIILEDLSCSGYRMEDRQQGLNLESSTLYFKKIAEFHALTASYYDRFGEFGKPFDTTYFNYEAKHFFDMTAFKCINEFLAIFDQYEQLRPYQSKILKYQDGLFEALYNSIQLKPGEFATLNHGDSWLNNMMFRYDENNNPIEIRLLDFQIANFGTPLLDLIYFFVTSTSTEVRKHHFDELLHLYHEHLTATLTTLNYSRRLPTLRELHQEFLQKGFVSIYYLATVLPIILLDSKDVDKDQANKMFDDNKQDAAYRYNLYNNPLYIEKMAVTCKFLNDRGLLEKI